jgi:hypothetical protein
MNATAPTVSDNGNPSIPKAFQSSYQPSAFSESKNKNPRCCKDGFRRGIQLNAPTEEARCLHQSHNNQKPSTKNES